MRPSTLSLSILLALAVGYAGFLRLEIAGLRRQVLASAETREGEQFNAAGDSAAAPRGEGSSTSEAEARQASAAAVISAESEARENVPSSTWQERRRQRSERMASLFENPEMRLDMVEREMTRIDSIYADYFETLDLDPEDIDTLKTLMAERNVIRWEARMRSSAAETDEEREQVEADMRLQREVVGMEIDELLGDEASASMKDYADSLPYRREVESLASSLSYTDTPLLPEQSELLVQKIHTVASEFQYTKDLSDIRHGRADELTQEDVAAYFQERQMRDSLVIDAAAEALNEEQLAAFAERQIADREREERRMRFMLENGGRAFGRGRGR